MKYASGDYKGSEPAARAHVRADHVRHSPVSADSL
jgi:hypothetical protein